MVPTKLTNIQRAAAQPGVQAHGEGEGALLREPVAAPEGDAVEEVQRHGSGHEPVEEVGMAEAAATAVMQAPLRSCGPTRIGTCLSRSSLIS
jgi:hypothetical protein